MVFFYRQTYFKRIVAFVNKYVLPEQRLVLTADVFQSNSRGSRFIYFGLEVVAHSPDTLVQ